MKTPGVKDCATVVGYNMLSGVTNTYSTFFFINLEEWAKRKKSEEQYNAIKDHISRGLRGIPGAIGFAFPRPPSRHRHLRRGHVHSRGPCRQGYPVPHGERQQVHGGGAETSRAGGRQHHVPPLGSPDLHGRGPGQGAEARRQPLRRLQDPPGLPGKRLRQLLQPFRPPVAGLRPGRGGLPHEIGGRWPILRAQQRGADGPLSALTSARNIAGPEFTMRYNLYRSAQINASSARG